MCLKAFWFFSAGHFQFRKHTLTESDCFEIRAVLDYWLGSRGCMEWWSKLGRSMFGVEFVAFIDSEIPRLAAHQGAAADAARPPPSEADDPVAPVTHAIARSGGTEPRR